MSQPKPSALRKGPRSQATDQRLRVLHAFKIYYPEVYGGIPYAIEQAMQVRPDLFEHELLVCSTDPTACANQMEGVGRVRSFGNLFSLPLAPFYPLRLWQRMKTADVVVLHAPFPLADLVLGLGLRRKVPLIVYWHSDIVSQRFLGRVVRPLLMATLRRAKAILLSNERILHRSELVDQFAGKLKSLPYPVDVQRFVLSADERSAVQALKVRYPRLVLAVGRLVKYKGFDILIEAARSVDADFLIVGEGVERPALQAAIDHAELHKRVRLVGALEERDLVVHLHAADVFALPSVTNAETFGIAQLEAMAAGCPVVNTQLNTMVPLVARHNTEAITVQPRDVGALATAITTLLDDPAPRAHLAANAKKRAHAFSTATFAHRFQEAVCEAAALPTRER